MDATDAYAASARHYGDVFEGFVSYRAAAVGRIMGEIEAAVRECRFAVDYRRSECGGVRLSINDIPGGAADVSLFASLGQGVVLRASDPGLVVAVVDVQRHARLRSLAVSAMAPVRAAVLSLCVERARLGRCADATGRLAGAGERARWPHDAAADGADVQAALPPPEQLQFDFVPSDLHSVPGHFRHALALEMAFLDDDRVCYVGFAQDSGATVVVRLKRG